MSRLVTFLCLLLALMLVACASDSAETPTPQQPAATVDSAPVILPTRAEITADEAVDAYPVATAAPAEAQPVQVEAEEAYPVAAAELPTPLPIATEAVTLTMDVASVVSPTATEAAPVVEDDFQPPVVPAQEQPSTVSSQLAGLVFKNAAGLWKVAANGDVILLTAPVAGSDWATTPVALSPDGTQLALVVEGDLHIFSLTEQTIERVVESSAETECCYIEWIGDSTWLFGSQLTGAGFGADLGVVSYFDSNVFSYDLLVETASFGYPAVAEAQQLVAISEAGQPRIINFTNGEELAVPLDAIGKAWSAGWDATGNRLAWLGSPSADSSLLGLALIDLAAGTTEFVSTYTPLATEWLPSRPAWQPNGDWIAYEAIPQQTSDAGVWLIHAADRSERFVGPGTNPRWHPDGTRLVFETINGIELHVIETGENSATLLEGQLVGWTAP